MNLYVDPNTSEVFGYDDEQVASGVVRSGLIPCPARPTVHHTWSNGWVLNIEAQSQVVSDMVNECIAAIQAALDAAARAKGYDDIKSAALRAAFSGPFHAEGVAFAQWMDECWSSAYAVLAQVQAGQRAMPTPGEAVAMMPTLELPQ